MIICKGCLREGEGGGGGGCVGFTYHENSGDGYPMPLKLPRQSSVSHLSLEFANTWQFKSKTNAFKLKRQLTKFPTVAS